MGLLDKFKKKTKNNEVDEHGMLDDSMDHSGEIVNESEDIGGEEIVADNKPKKKGSSKLLLSAVVAGILLGGGAFVYTEFFMNHADNNYAQSEFGSDFGMDTLEPKMKSDKNLEVDAQSAILREKQTIVEEKPLITTPKEEKKEEMVIAKEESAPIIKEKPRNKEVMPTEKEEIVVQQDQHNLILTDKIADEVKVTTDDVKLEILDSLNIGKDGKIDPFLQQYQSTIDNNKKIEQLKSGVALMEGASEFLAAKRKYDAQIELYRADIYEKENRGRVEDMKQVLRQELSKMEREIGNLRQESANLKNAIDSRNQTMQNIGATSSNVSHTPNMPMMDGLIGDGGSNLMLSPSFNGIYYTQTIYRVGDNYIMEEQDDTGSIQTYRVGSVYRGGVITAIGTDLIKLKIGQTTHLVSVGGSGGGQMNYNFISISMPSSSSVKNAQNVQQEKRQGPRDYREVQQERQRANDVARQDINNYFRER